MSKIITVHSQEELDKALYTVKPGYFNTATGEIVLPEAENSSDKDVIIRIDFGTKSDPAYLSEANSQNKIEVINNSYVVAHDRYDIKAKDNSTVEAHGLSFVEAYDKSTVILLDKSICEAHDTSKVNAYSYSYVDAFDHSCVRTFEGATAGAYDDSSITKEEGE